MYKLIYETPQGKHEVIFPTKPNGWEMVSAATELREDSELPALLKPKKEAA